MWNAPCNILLFNSYSSKLKIYFNVNITWILSDISGAGKTVTKICLWWYVKTILIFTTNMFGIFGLSPPSISYDIQVIFILWNNLLLLKKVSNNASHGPFYIAHKTFYRLLLSYHLIFWCSRVFKYFFIFTVFLFSWVFSWQGFFCNFFYLNTFV